MESVTRRRFLWMLAGAAGLGGWAFWRLPSEEPAPVAGASTTTSTTPSTSTVATVPVPTTIPTPPVVLEVIERNGWGARAAAADFGTHVIERMTIHHTAVALPDNRAAPARLRGHQAYHQEQGWPDVAYHYSIDRGGNVYEARPYTAPGDTFTDYDPSGHFLPVLEGNYGEQQPTEPQIESLVRLLAWASTEFGVATDTIAGHRDYAATTCPGDSVYSLVADGSIRRRVDDRIESGGVEMVVLRGDAALARVAGIEA